MLEDINRTFSKCFGWVFTVQPMGLKFFAVLALVACVCALFTWRFLAVLCAVVAVFCAYFFRDPVRNTAFTEDEIACPADGTVLSIKTEEDPNSVQQSLLSADANHRPRHTPLPISPSATPVRICWMRSPLPCPTSAIHAP